MREMILFSYHDTTVFINDALTLREGLWLNDAVLCFYFEYLTHEVLRALPPNIRSKELIFIPINDGDSVYVQGGNGSHWSLLVYSRQHSPSFHYYDSAANINYNYAMAAKRKLELMLYGDAEANLPMTTHSCPQQENGSDCGIFVILFADLLARRYADMRLPQSPQLQNANSTDNSSNTAYTKQEDSSRSVANLRMPNAIAAGYSMLAAGETDLIQRVMSPFAFAASSGPGAVAESKNKVRTFRQSMLRKPEIERLFWWIDYGDLCNPNRARKMLRQLVNDECARNSAPFI
ncbi:hypothetical protein GGI07_003156 [Coemansia sp. Benny D115]|nr:hypothetical protein GGI07_003156 [Coemansia sp. Benny D115]